MNRVAMDSGVDEIMDYDSDLVLCGRMANQKVRLTFGDGVYRATKEVVVNGNCTGLSVIEYAVEIVYRGLPCGSDGKEIELYSGHGGTLFMSDDEGREDEWLKDMLIAAEIN
jgi:hypothetical protein